MKPRTASKLQPRSFHLLLSLVLMLVMTGKDFLFVLTFIEIELAML